ncbi:hypothetical protein LTS10_008401 [Elasticomyces elasticus]|nr:hypothetical protein LTS10_008401 [Elasticomyces elasticus]
MICDRLLGRRRYVPSIGTQRCFQSTTATKTDVQLIEYRKGPFTKFEDDRILECRRQKIPMADVAAELGRTQCTVSHRFYDVLQVGGPWPEAANRPFSKADDERILHMTRENKTVKVLATELHRSMASIRSRVDTVLRHGGTPPAIRTFKTYSSAENNRILELKRQKTPTRIIARELGRSVASVSSRCSNTLFLGDRPATRPKKPYSKSDDEEILRMWRAGTKVRMIGKALGRAAGSVQGRLHGVLSNGSPRPIARRLSSPDPKRQFTVEEFDRIAALMAAGHSARVVADMFHMTLGTFNDVWRRVQARPASQLDPSRRYCALPEKMNIIRLRREQKLSQVQIARETGRSLTLVSRVLRSSLNGRTGPKMKTVPYSSDEDAELIEYRERHGMTYAQSATRMTRSAASIGTRYGSFLKDRQDKSTKAGYWTVVEDQTLQNLLEEGNMSYDEIAGQLPGRSSKAVRERIQWKRRHKAEGATVANSTTPEEAKVAISTG